MMNESLVCYRSITYLGAPSRALGALFTRWCRLGSSQQSLMYIVSFLGQGNAQARPVADEIIDVLSQNSSSSRTTVCIVIFQKPLLKDFHSSMQQREAADPNPKDKGG